MIAGVDPGLTGAIALLHDDGRFFGVFDMPTMAKGSGKKRCVNAADLSKILSDQHEMTVKVVLERVSAMPKQGVSSVFSFGESYGVCRGVVAALGIPLEQVTPQAWKKKFSLIGKDKDAARTLAIETWPLAPLSRKKDQGRADALLIAKFGL